MSFYLPTMFAEAAWTDWLFSARALGIALWVGLAALTISLLILMRTRWGQVQPISKCVVLSVFAHVLLIGYAYGTMLIFDPAPVRVDDVTNVTFFETDDVNASTKDLTEASPWDAAESAADVRPDFTPPKRQPSDAPRPAEPKTVATVPLMGEGPPSDVVGTIQPERPIAKQPDISDPRERTSPVQPESIGEPNAAQRQEVEPLVPTGPDLKRAPTDDTAESRPTDADPRRPPSEVFDLPDQIRRLDELSTQSPDADAFRHQQDNLVATNSSKGGSPSDDAQNQPRSASETTPSNQPQSPTNAGQDQAAAPRRLGDGAPLPSVYLLRTPQNRLDAARKNGGDADTEAAVDLALRWLAANQSEDGRWDASDLGAGIESKVLGQDRLGAGAQADTGVTGLALLAFLAAGHSHLEGDYRDTVERGLAFLRRAQRRDGNLAGPADTFSMMYCHGMATLALAEAFAITGDHNLKPSVESAVRYTVAAQHPISGGWRYQPGEQGDMSQFGWQVMALKSAELGGIPIPRQTREGMLRFMQSTSAGRYGGLSSYRPGDAASTTMTAEALACRAFLGLPIDSAATGEAVERLTANLPAEGKANLYYWYYATIALRQIEGDAWKAWNSALVKQLLSRQRKAGRLAGSWDSDTVWGGYGGRAYSTATAALCLEAYYRYLPVLSR